MKLLSILALLQLFILPGVSARVGEWEVTDPNFHSQVWERTAQELDTVSGQTVQRHHRYVELATGLNYQKDGQWFASREEIELLPNGFAAARQGQHQVIFSPNANSIPAVDLLAPDSKRFQSRIFGIVYYDAATGNSELLAELKDSVGELVSPNRVLYPDAFDGLHASIRLTYTRAGLEQDIILHENPPSPALFQLNPLTTRLEVWTEFFEAPVPEKRARIVKQTIGLPALIDVELSFGQMRMGRGKAFELNNAQSEVPVLKDWQRIDGRDFLIEGVEYPATEPLLQGLPQAAARKRKENDALVAGKLSRAQVLASAGHSPARPSSGRIQLARADAPAKPGVLIDYTLLNSGLTNFTFKGDTTYYVSGSLAANTNVFEGGTVVKFAPTNSAKLTIAGPVSCLSSAYNPIVLTARDDHSIGEAIGSAALSGYYADTALYFDYSASSSVYDLHDIRVSYASTALSFDQGRGTPQGTSNWSNASRGLVVTMRASNF